MKIAPWRARLQPASYQGVVFHVDVGSRSSGRRVALHEFPKKDIPYAEDMGRKARKFTLTAYVIASKDNGWDYTPGRDSLIIALEADGTGLLIHPTSGQDTVVVDTYSVTERRERGGICEFEISFVEAGQDISGLASIDTQAAVKIAVDDATSSQMGVPEL